MSTELIGNCGYTVGERGYFERINKAFGLSEVINFSVGYDYYNGIKNFCDKLSSIISEVYSDVRNNAKIMSFLDERDREETINIVEGLNEVCKMWARSCSDADRAKSILSLSASETRLKSGYKKNEIEKTARKVIRGSYSGVSSSEKIRLLEKAISSSVIRAANGNAEKLAYLLDIEQGKGDNFLFDVLFKCEYDANPRRYTGRNGKEICSRSYNSNILSEAFGNSTISSNSYGYSKKFSEILGKRFERVCKEMEDDIDKGIRNRDYILDSNGERMKTAIAQIEKVGMSCYGLRGKVDVLMWFVGGNQRDVLQLQTYKASVDKETFGILNLTNADSDFVSANQDKFTKFAEIKGGASTAADTAEILSLEEAADEEKEVYGPVVLPIYNEETPVAGFEFYFDELNSEETDEFFEETEDKAEIKDNLTEE